MPGFKVEKQTRLVIKKDGHSVFGYGSGASHTVVMDGVVVNSGLCCGCEEKLTPWEDDEYFYLECENRHCPNPSYYP